MVKLFSVSCRRMVAVVAMLLFSIGISAQNLTVKVNDGAPLSGQNSLEAAIEESGVLLGDITRLEVSHGDFLTSDWVYLKANSGNISSLREFVITDGIGSVEDMPDIVKPNDKYFARSLVKFIAYKLKNIGASCFADVYSLKYIEIPDAISIGATAFSQCPIEYLNLPSAINIDEAAFERMGFLVFADLPVVRNIAKYAFYECYSLTSVNLPVVEDIGLAAFGECCELTVLRMGGTPPTVSKDLFICDLQCPFHHVLELVDADGQNLTGDVLDEAIASYKAVNDGDISDNFWYSCLISPIPPTTKVKINGIDTEYESNSVEEAVLLSHIDFSDIISLEIIGNKITRKDLSFSYKLPSLQTLTIDVELRVLEYYSYSNLSVFIGNKIHRIFHYDVGYEPVFPGCVNLNKVNFPAATDIGQEAFLGCSSLTSVSLPSVRNIGARAFFDCENLTFLQLGAIPPSAGGAFECARAIYCDEYPIGRYLELIDVSGKPLVGDAFESALAAYLADDDGDTSDELWWGWTIVRPRTVIKINDQDNEFEGESIAKAIATSGADINTITHIELMSGDISAADSMYMHDNLIALQQFSVSAEMDKLQRMLPCLREFNGVGVKSVDAGVFKDFAQLTTVSLPAVTSIGDEAFANCGVFTMLSLGATPPTVGEEAFKNCPTPRYLQLVDADGNPLEGRAFVAAREQYLANATRSAQTWHGWTLLLPCNQPITGDTTATACGSFRWYGTDYSTSGEYLHTLTASTGCDSVVTLHLTVNKPTTGDTTATACGSFRWYGTDYSTSGEYLHTLTASTGCDSVVTLHLTITQPALPSQPSGLFDEHYEPLSVFPNPTTEAVQVEAAGVVYVYNASGLLMQRVVSQGKVLLDFSDYTPGLYIIRVRNALAKVIKR